MQLALQTGRPHITALDTMGKSTATEQLKGYLRRAIKRYDIPGASVSIVEDGRITHCAYAGIANVESGLRVHADTVFQIASVTKPMTATLIMQLVDEKLVDLDDRVSRFLPGWNRSTRVTIRHLLNHTSGVEGDFSVDAGRGDGAIRRYVDKATMLPSYFQPGEMMSYCNAGLFGTCALARSCSSVAHFKIAFMTISSSRLA